jgi:hypothetical protein
MEIETPLAAMGAEAALLLMPSASLDISIMLGIVCRGSQ